MTTPSIVQKSLTELSELDYYYYHLSVVEVFMPSPLTPKLKELLACFMMVGKDNPATIFDTRNRKTVRNILKGKSQASISNQLDQLHSRGYLKKVGAHRYSLIPNLLPSDSGLQVYQIKLKQKMYE